jgi:hypothetical protein
MTKMRVLAIFCVEAMLTTIASAKDPRTGTVPAHAVRRTPSPVIEPLKKASVGRS